MVTLSSDVQLLKIYWGNVSTPAGTLKLVNSEQPQNADSPMLETEEGSVILGNF